jgi:hypothetical protein
VSVEAGLGDDHANPLPHQGASIGTLRRAAGGTTVVSPGRRRP